MDWQDKGILPENAAPGEWRDTARDSSGSRAGFAVERQSGSSRVSYQQRVASQASSVIT